jgi:hypothetical protein
LISDLGAGKAAPILPSAADSSLRRCTARQHEEAARTETTLRRPPAFAAVAAILRRYPSINRFYRLSHDVFDPFGLIDEPLTMGDNLAS